MASFLLTRRTLLLGLALILPTTALAGEKIYRRKGEGPRRKGKGPVSANLIRVLQTELSNRGFNPGPADGLKGPKTRSAIREFQSAKGLEVTGNISKSLLVALGLAQPSAAK